MAENEITQAPGVSGAAEVPAAPPAYGGIAFTPKKVAKDLSKVKLLIYGPPKIGKSTLASKFPGPLFLATEEGLDWIECHKISIVDWDTTPLHVDEEGHLVGSLLSVMRWLDEYRPKVVPGTEDLLRTVVIDNIDIAYDFCLNHVCTMAGISDPSDLEWGKGWKAVGSEWQRVLTLMSKLPYGLFFTSHSKQVERKSKSTKVDIVTPSISNAGAQRVMALVDIIMYCYTTEEPEYDENGQLTGRIKEKRVIRCQPQNNIIAGDRTKCLPLEIPMDFEELLKYFPDTPQEFLQRVVDHLQKPNTEVVNEPVNEPSDGSPTEAVSDNSGKAPESVQVPADDSGVREEPAPGRRRHKA